MNLVACLSLMPMMEMIAIVTTEYRIHLTDELSSHLKIHLARSLNIEFD